MHFPHDDMYYDRTWFDELGAWVLQTCRRYLPRRRKQLWSTGFALFAGLCVAWAAGLATHCVVFDAAPNECLAELLAAALLLVAAKHFLAATGMSATSALPRRKLIRRTDVPLPPTGTTPDQHVKPVPSSKLQRESAADLKQFFCAVRNAGINMRIARTLYAAGLCSGEQVRNCDDARLLAIDGIGKATLRKLRVQFGIPGHTTKPQSSAA